MKAHCFSKYPAVRVGMCETSAL
uniref:Uncharacterized protein n=1 Tax=Anguilla anguilla TaxID=7936 RepID=A0A0E9V205_ANGAN